MQKIWNSLGPFVDNARFRHVSNLLEVQESEARWWRDACLSYFRTFAGLPIPAAYEQPSESLEYYKCLEHYFVPGIRERRFD